MHTDEFGDKEKEKGKARWLGSLKEIWKWGEEWHERKSGSGVKSECTGVQGRFRNGWWELHIGFWSKSLTGAEAEAPIL